jgi:hypothetical protein
MTRCGKAELALHGTGAHQLAHFTGATTLSRSTDQVMNWDRSLTRQNTI